MFDLLSFKNCFRLSENRILLTGSFAGDDTLQPIYSAGVYWWEISPDFHGEKHVNLLLGAKTTSNLLGANHDRFAIVGTSCDHQIVS